MLQLVPIYVLLLDKLAVLQSLNPLQNFEIDSDSKLGKLRVENNMVIEKSKV